MRIHEFLSGFQICILIVPTSYDSFATVVTQQNGDYNNKSVLSPYAIYIPCATHTLSLVWGSAVDCCLINVNFFQPFSKSKVFAASTHRWAVIKQHAVSVDCA